jgi:hypothetical protein
LLVTDRITTSPADIEAVAVVVLNRNATVMPDEGKPLVPVVPLARLELRGICSNIHTKIGSLIPDECV